MLHGAWHEEEDMEKFWDTVADMVMLSYQQIDYVLDFTMETTYSCLVYNNVHF